MRFEVPQFIEIEDKIFGPFTWRQFVYLAGGVWMSIVLFFIAPFWVTFVVGIPVSILAAALAFYPVNTRPFSVLLESMFNFYKNRRTYHWRRNREIIYKDGGTAEQVTGVTNYTEVPGSSESGISSLTRKLEMETLKAENEILDKKS